MGLPVTDRRDIATAISDMTAFEDGLMANGCSLPEIDECITLIEYYRDERPRDESVELMGILAASLLTPAENSTLLTDFDSEREHKPRFQTSLSALEKLTRGGYGLTTVGGDAKAGKTLFALGTAISAAMQGWRVVYFNAELDEAEILLAVMRYCEGSVPDIVRANLTIISPDFTFQPADAVRRVQEAVRFGDTRVLICLDSINALVDMASGGDGGDYWAANATWRNFAVRATRLSQGRLAFLVVSETNKDGGIKGRSLEFKSDLVVRIQKDKDESDGVTIDVTHSRSTRSGPLGRFTRDWDRGRFVQWE